MKKCSTFKVKQNNLFFCVGCPLILIPISLGKKPRQKLLQLILISLLENPQETKDQFVYEKILDFTKIDGMQIRTRYPFYYFF